MDKRGQTGGLITGLVFGVASLVIAVIIAFVIVSTLSDAELLTGGRKSFTTTNESQNSAGVTQIVFVNQTGYTLNKFDSATTKGVSITSILADANQTNGSQSGILRTATGYTVTVPSANFTASSSTGIVRNATTFIYPNVTITYSITNESSEEASSDNLRANFTEGVDNVSDKVPTVLLIAAVILILGVLVILVGVWQRMRMGGGDL